MCLLLSESTYYYCWYLLVASLIFPCTTEYSPFNNQDGIQLQTYSSVPKWRIRRQFRYDENNNESGSGRYLRPQTLYTISETLGALNTVGRYLFNMTRSNRRYTPTQTFEEDVPNAIYTLSQKVLGPNVTDAIAPFVREALPHVVPTTERIYVENPDLNSNSNSNARSCTTPDGTTGQCNDLSDCPQLLLNLSNLRQSLCFKSLFVPGVCCPKDVTPINPTIDFNEATTTRATTTTTTTTTRTLLLPSPSATTLLPPLIVDPLDCGQPEVTNFRVVGGEEAQPGSWPWMSAIFLHGPRRTEFWCGGTLITDKHVLTAAHCTKDSSQRSFSPRQFTVRLGDVDLRRDDEPSAPVTYGVTKVTAHPKFSRVGYYNDIALLELDTRVRKSKYIIPICLPNDNRAGNENFAGRSATVVGWGTTNYGGKESSVQRKAELPIWRNEDCNRAYFQPITSNFVCAGYARGGTDACQGDSGGPLMLQWDSRWIQIGIVSFGNKCGEPGYPGVYTRVTEYRKWIQENAFI